MDTALIAIIIVVIIITIAFSWHKGWLNSYLPVKYQHKAAFRGEGMCGSVASTLDPNVPCIQCGDPTYFNACGHV